MTLTEHIKTHHNSDRDAFAKSQGVSYSQVGRWLKRNCLVDNGVVYCEVSKRIKTELESK